MALGPSCLDVEVRCTCKSLHHTNINLHIIHKTSNYSPPSGVWRCYGFTKHPHLHKISTSSRDCHHTSTTGHVEMWYPPHLHIASISSTESPSYLHSFLYLSQLMRLWHFSSSINSFFKRACAAFQWGYMPDFLVGPFVYFHTSCVRTATLARLFIWKWATSWENLLLPYVNNKGVDQPAHPRSRIRAFVVRCLDSNEILQLKAI